jgi:HAE1 family hydrophobic/amphiphilic exporter-1
MEASNRVANDLKAHMAAMEGTRDVELSRDDLRPEYNVVFDRNKLAYYGINSATAAQFVRNRINGLIATQYREDGDEYDVVVRYGESYRTTFEDVENITLYTGNSPVPRPIKLKEVASVEEEFAAPTIERENRQRVVTVQASLGEGVALGTVVDEVNEMLADYELPEGIYVEVGGSMEDLEDMLTDFVTLLVLVVLLVYIVMATQFESLWKPGIIMSTILFAFTGVFLALWMTSTPLSMIALIGAIMLVGIVTKNGIVMIDYTNLLVERGRRVKDAVVASGKSRLRPVLMTSLTTILGMLPMAIGIGNGSELWQPMGIAIIGGLTFSTLLTLFVVPVLYAVVAVRQEDKQHIRIRNKKERLAKRIERAKTSAKNKK